MFDRKREKPYKSSTVDRSLLVTGVVIAMIAVLLIGSYFMLYDVLRKRSLGRMEEGVDRVTTEVTAKLNRDSRLLNAVAAIISQTDNFDVEATRAVMTTVTPLLETMRIRILTPDDQILMADGSMTSTTDQDDLFFAAEAPLGEHVSGRMVSTTNGKYVLRHFVPIVQDGEVAALLYGTTELEDLPKILNIDSIYNASANIYIVDTKTGDMLLDTRHETLGNIRDFSSKESKAQTKDDKEWDEYISDMMNLKSGYVVYRTENTNGWEYLYYGPAGINEWSICVGVPESEAFISVFVLRRIYICLGIILTLIMLMYYVYVSNNAKRNTHMAVEQAVLQEKLQKAEAAHRAKTVFLSNMSHDIRTPMNAIIGFTTLAQTNLDNKERTKEYLKKILASSNHLLSLINDILDMSRIESGKLNIEEKECSISEIFRDMRNIIQGQMSAKQLDFFMDTVDVMDEEIYCDKLHLNQVLLNLLSNAIKFTPAGGTVALTIQQKNGAPEGYGAYELRVKDTGMGMSQEFVERIFEPFERERNSTVSGIQGTGLGMAITKNIIDAMGGTIKVQSEQGKGTEFIINLEFRLQGEKEQIGVSEELRGLRALVVDDNFVTCDSVSKMLCQIGMRTDWVLHGKEAILHVKQAKEMADEYHAYIVDWFLPDLSGLEVVRQIRTIVGDGAPIIIVTAYDWSAFEDEARAAGATAFCNNPIFLSELRDILLHSQETSKAEEDVVISDVEEQWQGTRLLLTEDNELNREIAEEILTDAGFVVETAEDGSVAVEMIERAEAGYYALVLMDIQMPQMDGYTATRAIRSMADSAKANVPIVAMTANAFDEDKARAAECGMNAHVAKPIDVEKLMGVITAILRGEQPGV